MLCNLFQDFIDSANNILSIAWDGDDKESTEELSVNYLRSVEELVKNIQVNQSKGHNTTLIEFQVRPPSATSSETISDVGLAVHTSEQAKILAIKNLTEKLPNNKTKEEIEYVSNSIMITVALEGNISKPDDKVDIDFSLRDERRRNHKVLCVWWKASTQEWDETGCKWTLDDRNSRAKCECKLQDINRRKNTGSNSGRVISFSTLMSKKPIELKYLEELSLIGLGVSICSLVIFIMVECLVWNSVTKTNIAFFRHMVLVNIATFLLLANSCFLVSFLVKDVSDPWCLILALAKHFFYLAMFFWMFCLSMVLLHQLVFIFSPVRRKTFFFLSSSTGYVCPMVTVAVTYLYYRLTNGHYYDPLLCWLDYKAPMQGSIHAFVIPVGVIILINLFTMVKVIVTHLRPQISEGLVDEREIARSILKVIAVLTPVFGVTWGLGFFVFLMDVGDDGTLAKLVNYAFTVTTSLQVSSLHFHQCAL